MTEKPLTPGAGRGARILLKGEIDMAASPKRTIEVFTAGCSVCTETIDLVRRIACPSCEVTVLDMQDPAVAARAKDLGIRTVPAIVVDGKLADCCANAGPDEASLRALGVGQPLA
jgi:hypothetical protein